MPISGVLILTNPPDQDAVARQVDALPWAEVHTRDELGRCIATVEGESTEEAIERLRILKVLPGVLSAEMIVHCFEDEDAGGDLPGESEASLLETLNNPQDQTRSGHFTRMKAQSSL